jgi:hypothetical protein
LKKKIDCGRSEQRDEIVELKKTIDRLEVEILGCKDFEGKRRAEAQRFQKEKEGDLILIAELRSEIDKIGQRSFNQGPTHQTAVDTNVIFLVKG